MRNTEELIERDGLSTLVKCVIGIKTVPTPLLCRDHISLWMTGSEFHVFIYAKRLKTRTIYEFFISFRRLVPWSVRTNYSKII